MHLRFLINYYLFKGPTLKTWYGVLDKRFGSTGGLTAAKKVLVDQSLMAPSFLAAILSIIGFSQGKSIQEVKTQLKETYVDVLLSNWTVSIQI